MSNGRCELLDEAPGSGGGKESVVAQHDAKAAQPTDFTEVPQQVEVGDACRGGGERRGEGGKEDLTRKILLMLYAKF